MTPTIDPIVEFTVDSDNLIAMKNAQKITRSWIQVMNTRILFKRPTEVAVKIGRFTYYLDTVALRIIAAALIGVALFVEESDGITTLFLEA